MKKLKFLYVLFLSFLLLFMPVLISGDENPEIFTDIKIKYLYVDKNNIAEYGEVADGQDLPIGLEYGEKFVVTIWNLSSQDFYLDIDEPAMIIEDTDYFYIPELPDRDIPAGKSVSFQIYLAILPSDTRRTTVAIKSDDPEDEDFEFGLWASIIYNGS